MNNNIRYGKMLIRLVISLVTCIFLITNFSGCQTIYRNYIDQNIDSDADVEKALATRGEINVILLPGCATKPGTQDTLFSCLKLSRDVNPESVKLPPDEKLYLGHVAEFILRSLKYYQLQESFKDFYGYRIILKFRKLTPQELRSKKFKDYSSFAVGSTSMVAGAATMTPLGIIVFLVDGIAMEIDRRDFEDRVAKMQLPAPKKNVVTLKLESGERTLLYVKDEISEEMTGKNSMRIQFDEKVASYMAEECLLEKVTPEEINHYQEQINLFRKNKRL
ncbi:MAG: hypothetical protein CVU43_21110 [Chloroflexi bacterium HGW-Chloroflexi-5]|nr:MAG: hypothetical protein CVU43_21110 [Chloroflexi bacterium HGW-Chloroflexi-5]